MSHEDEQAILDLMDTWMRASAAGDLEAVLPLMAEDVVFLTVGQPPMRRADFVAGFQGLIKTHRIEGKSDVQEIQVSGDMAYCWSRLTVTMVPLEAGSAMVREGHVLSVLRRKPGGGWVIARDANLMPPPARKT
jgi:uncharacterized protein (TIGR02246 family)